MGPRDHDTADLDKHTDAELQEGIERADEQEPRVAVESSDEAYDAQRRQREEMARELKRRRD
jgi:hypothetical protein